MPEKPQSTRPYLLTCGAQCEERRWPWISVISAPHSSTVTANSEQHRRRRSASCLRRSAYRRRPAPYRSARGTSESARFSTRTEPKTPKRIERAPRAHGAVSAAAALAKQAGARRREPGEGAYDARGPSTFTSRGNASALSAPLLRPQRRVSPPVSNSRARCGSFRAVRPSSAARSFTHPSSKRLRRRGSAGCSRAKPHLLCGGSSWADEPRVERK